MAHAKRGGNFEQTGVLHALSDKLFTRTIPIRNIGHVSERWLASVGIRSLDDLRRVGAVTAYAMVKRRQGKASLNLLWAMEASLCDIDWRELSDSTKRKLKEELEALTE